MRRLICASVALMACVLAVSASATSVIDQQQPTWDVGAGLSWVVGNSSFPSGPQRLAQVVTPALTGVLTEVRLVGSCWAPSLTVEIQDVSNGLPNGTVRGSQTSPFTFSPWSSFHGIVFAVPVPVRAGIPYAIVLAASGGYCLFLPGPVADAYAGGNAYWIDEGTAARGWRLVSHDGGRSDLPFQTLVEPPDTTPPILTVPRSIAVVAASRAGATVRYSARAIDDGDPHPAVSCTPATGTLFPIGTTSVTCTATDASGNRAAASFTVSVSPPVVKPVLGAAKTAPARPIAGRKLTFTLLVERSDTGGPLTTGRMECDPSVAGVRVKHEESFTNGKARLSFVVPRTARGKLLRVTVKITVGKRSATKVVTYNAT